MITIRAFPAPSGGKLPKFAAFYFEHQHSAGRAENQKVPFPIRIVIKAPADHPSVRQQRQAFGDDQFRRVTTFDRSLVDPSRHIYLPEFATADCADFTKRKEGPGFRRVALVQVPIWNIHLIMVILSKGRKIFA